jgi:hypothetical protein
MHRFPALILRDNLTPASWHKARSCKNGRIAVIERTSN